MDLPFQDLSATGLTVIPGNMFWGCYRLTSITFPSTLTTIEEYAFQECVNLPSVTIPSSVTTIEEGAFTGCYGLTSVTIPATVTTLGIAIFHSCTSLATVTVDDEITTSMFAGCPVTSITIGAAATIASDASCGDNGTGFTAAYSVGGAGTYEFTTVWTKQ